MRIVCIALALALCVASACKGSVDKAGPAGVVVAASAGSLAVRGAGTTPRELSAGDIIFSDDLVTAASSGELIIRLDHNNADLTLVSGAKVAIKDSAAWRAPKDVQAGLLEVDPNDGNAAAGRSGDREAADDPSAAAENVVGAGEGLGSKDSKVVVDEKLKIGDGSSKPGRPQGAKPGSGPPRNADKYSSGRQDPPKPQNDQVETTKKLEHVDGSPDPTPPPPAQNPGGPGPTGKGISRSPGYGRGPGDTGLDEGDSDDSANSKTDDNETTSLEADASKARSSVRVSRLRVTPPSNSTSRVDSVRSILKKHSRAIAHCGNAEVSKVLLRFVIGADGAVTNLEMTSRSVPATVSGCVAKRVRRIRFKAGERRTVQVLIELL